MDEVETGSVEDSGSEHLWAELPPLLRFFHEKEAANVLSVMGVGSVFQLFTIIFLKKLHKLHKKPCIYMQ